MTKLLDRLGGLWQSIGLFTVINVGTKVFPFLLLPILTAHLTPAEFGRAAMFLAASSLLIPFIGLRGDALLIRTMGEKSQNVDEVVALVMTLPVVTAALISGPLLVAPAIGIHVEAALGISWSWALLAIVTALMNCYLIINNAIYQFERRLRRYAVIQLTQATAAFVLTALLVGGPLQDSAGRNLGYALPILVLGAWSWYQLSRLSSGSFVFRFGQISALFGIALPLLGGTLASLLAGTIDRYAVSWYHGNDSVGIYAFGVTLGLIYAVLAEGIDLAWMPHVAAAGKDCRAVRRLRNTAWIIVTGLASGGAVYALCIPYVVAFMGRSEAYVAATPVALATVVAVVCKAGFNVFSTIAIFTGQQKTSFMINGALTLLLPVGIWVAARSGGLSSPQYAVATIYGVCALTYVLLVSRPRGDA